MTTRRRRAREVAVEVLYQQDLVGEDPAQLLTSTPQRLRLNAETTQYLKRLVEQTMARRPEIDGILSQTLKNWRLDRLSFVDRAILRMACCEILQFDDIPVKVSINEAVELAKFFGDEKSGQFVNGVLDAIAKQYPKKESRGSAPCVAGSDVPGVE